MDIKERNAVIESNLGLIISIARKLSRDHDSQQELISEGVIGIIKGFDKFDETRGSKLTSFMWMYAHRAMLRYITHNSDRFNIGRKSSEFEKIKIKLGSEETFNWTQKDMAAFALKNDFKIDKVAYAYSASQFGQLHDNIPSNTPSVSLEVEKMDVLDKISEFVSSLKPFQQDAFYLVYAGVGSAKDICSRQGYERNSIPRVARKVKQSLTDYLQVGV